MLQTWIVATLVFLTDFVLKGYLRAKFPFSSLPIIPNVFHITLVFNRGAAFGILQEKSTFLIYAGIIFVLIFFLLMRREEEKRTLFLVACGLIIGGALSNLWDRIFLGYVVDYIDLRIWPVFNISDFSITVGVVLLLWQSYRNRKEIKLR
jgi:signal peptidase II